MRKISTGNIVPGMKVAANIIGGDGSVLLARGVELTLNYIDRLKEIGIQSLYIEDELSKDIIIKDVILEQTRMAALQTIHSIADSCRRDKKIDLPSAQKVVNTIVDEISAQRNLMINFSDLRLKNDYQFAHAVNVCVLSIALGISLQFNELQLRNLGVGALLHDIGMVKIPEKIIRKPGKLTKAEYAEVQKHPWLGFNILRATEGINILSAHAALQHHERLDGKGYPRGLYGQEIHDFGQIVAVADVYDAMTHDQVYRAALPVYEVISILRSASPACFAPHLINRFIDSIAVYPLGTLVALNNKAVGIVVDVNLQEKAKPIVRIIVDDTGRIVAENREVDLTRDSRLFISEVFDEDRLRAILVADRGVEAGTNDG